jgi:glucan phosphoethanolaminetransferase (alkaline phosphatase superfamily)
VVVQSRPGAKEELQARSHLWSRVLDALPAAARLGGLWLATWALLLLPDLLLYWRGYPVNAATSSKAILFTAGIALLITMAKSRRFRMAAIAFIAVNQIVWTGYVVYFRQALTPEQLLLVQHEATDTVLGIWDGWRSLLPWLVTLLAGTGALALIQWRDGPNTRWRSRIAGVTFVVVLVAACTAWMTHPRIAAAFPGKHTASMYGPFQAAVGAVRLGLTRVAAASLNIRGQTETQDPLGPEPITIVVIMGESINPARLSLFGFERDTTPQLAKWRSSPPEGFALIPEMGFSGGLDTYASVPGFLRAAYWPVRGQEFGVSLFELAHKQGFKSWYFTAQTLNFLQAAGGAPHAERIETAANDDGLAELARQVPEDAEKAFVFLHQRVNHTPYTSNCAPAPDGLYIFDAETGSGDDRRRATYDNGLRCWDRDVSALVAPFLKRRGAVHIFITSDHSELMAENGSWGHGFTDLRVAMVPMMLLTNRPQSEVATLYKSWSPPTTYHLAQTVARAFGVRLETPGTAANRFFLNNTMPFALAGFMEVEQLRPGEYRVKNFARNGQMLSEEITNLPEIEKANAAYGPPEVLSAPLQNPPVKTGKAG